MTCRIPPSSVFACLALLLASCGFASTTPCPPALENLNVAWSSPSTNAAGSMPIGNGELGLNVWVDQDGAINLYLARTDAWSEISRLLKLGKVRIQLTPNPFRNGAAFKQELRLRDGRIEIHGKGQRPEDPEATVTVWVDPQSDTAFVTGRASEPIVVRTTYESWRADTKYLKGEELQSSWTMQEAPADLPISESADVVFGTKSKEVVFYHRNEHSIVPLSLELQGLASAKSASDPLLRRTFGGIMSGPNFRLADTPVQTGVISAALVSQWPSKEFSLRIATRSSRDPSPEAWLRETRKASDSAAASLRRNTSRWNEFWDRSWIFLEPANNPSNSLSAAAGSISRGYALQRWMFACAGKGNYPIKFNGSLFTVDPEFSGGPRENPDWRRWGESFWWQNTRLPYATMLASGDYDQFHSLFRFYNAAAPLARERVRIYNQGQGLYFPETLTPYFTWANKDYGWARSGHTNSEVLNLYIRHIWQQGLELVNLQLDFYDHTQDDKFLRQQLLPMADDVLRYFETRFGPHPGKLRIEPTQSAETYWYGVVNDTPTVAGLQCVTERLLSLPSAKLPRAYRERLLALRERLPALPVKPAADGTSQILPAEQFDPKRSNVENPELYAVWPFKLFGLERRDLDTAKATFNSRHEKSMVGWSYDAQCAALLGLTDEAARQVAQKAGNSHTNHRFPAMWGPNYDWVPDQDHGSSVMLTLQLMLLQPVGNKLLVCPAWPPAWNVRFKLHAPDRTTVEAEVSNGLLKNLVVTPEARKKDVVIGSGLKTAAN